MDTRATVIELHKAYREGDAERVASLIHDDIDWCIHGPARVFPFEGPRQRQGAGARGAGSDRRSSSN